MEQLSLEEKAKLYDFISDEFSIAESAYDVLDTVEFAVSCPRIALVSYAERLEEGLYSE